MSWSTLLLISNSFCGGAGEAACKYTWAMFSFNLSATFRAVHPWHPTADDFLHLTGFTSGPTSIA